MSYTPTYRMPRRRRRRNAPLAPAEFACGASDEPKAPQEKRRGEYWDGVRGNPTLRRSLTRSEHQEETARARALVLGNDLIPFLSLESILSRYPYRSVFASSRPTGPTVCTVGLRIWVELVRKFFSMYPLLPQSIKCLINLKSLSFFLIKFFNYLIRYFQITIICKQETIFFQNLSFKKENNFGYILIVSITISNTKHNCQDIYICIHKDILTICMFFSFNKLQNFIRYLKNNSGKNAIIHPLYKSTNELMNVYASCKLCQ